MNEEKPDYNDRELELVQEFYTNSEGENYFRSFFTNPPQPVLPGIWVKKFIIDKASRVLSKTAIEKNSVSFGTLHENIFNNAIAYGNETSAHLLTLKKEGDDSVESYQLVLDWMSINVRNGYDLHQSLDVSLYKSASSVDGVSSPENTYDVVFDKQLGVLGPRSAIRMQMTYDRKSPLLYTAEGKAIERLPKSAVIFFEGKRLFELSLTGYVSEEVDANQPPLGNISSSLSKRTAGIYRFVCGLKNGGKLYSIGEKLEFVKFTSEQQIRAAVVLHVAKVFCYASIWRIYFAFLNSFGTFVEFVGGARWENRPSETAVNIDLLLDSKMDNRFFFMIEKDTTTEVNGVLIDTDKNEIKLPKVKETLAYKFSEWKDDKNRLYNSVTQAKRIQSHLFVQTETYQKEIDEKNKLLESTKDDLKQDVEYYDDLVKSNVGLSKNIEDYLQINPAPLQLFYNDFEERFDWTKVNSDLWSVEIVKQKIFAAADYIRSKAQSQMNDKLRFVTIGETLPLFQLLIQLLFAQQFLKAAAYMTEVMLKYAGNVDPQTISAPLRSSERKLAVFAARTLLDALPIERRTAGGKTEIFTTELEKIVASGGGNGQVPVPELDILNLMVNRINEMRGVTEEQIVAGFQEFYIQERFYFADIVHIPWTASSLDSNLLRFDILSSTDRANALFKLTSDLLLLGKEVANPVNKDAEPNPDVAKIIDTFLALPPLILKLIKNAVNDLNTDRSENDRNFSLQIVVALETALKNIGFYFDNVLSLETRTKAIESSARYNQMIATEKNVIDVLRMFKQEHTVPQRVPRLDTNVDQLVADILAGGGDAMQVGAPMRKTAFLQTGVLLDPLPDGLLNQLVQTFIDNTSKSNVLIRNVKEDWENRSNNYLRDVGMRDDDVIQLLAQVTWIISRYTGEKNALNSPLDEYEKNDATKQRAAGIKAEFGDRLKKIEDLVQNVYLKEKLLAIFTRNDVTKITVDALNQLKSDTANLLRYELVDAVDRIIKTYNNTVLIAQKMKDFLEYSKRGDIDQGDKAVTLSTKFDVISNAFRGIEDNKTVLDKLNVAVPIYEQARKLFDSASSIMKNLKASIKPEDAQRVELLTKQRELERLADMKKQIESFKGQLADSLKELQSTVAKAEKADSDASKLTAFLKDLQSLNSKIDEYNARIVAAQETLKNIDPEKMREKIASLKNDFPVYDEERNKLISEVPNLLKDISSLKRDVDKTATDVEKVRKEASQLSTSYEEARQDYDNVRETFEDFKQKVNKVNDAIDEQFVELDNAEKAIKSRTDTIQLRAANLKRLQKISEETAADSEQIKSKIIQKDKDISNIEVELARKVVEVRGTSKEYDTLVGRINFSYNEITGVTQRNGDSDLGRAISSAIIDVVSKIPQSSGGAGGVDLATVSQLVTESTANYQKNLIKSIDDYMRRAYPSLKKRDIETTVNPDAPPTSKPKTDPDAKPEVTKGRTIVPNDFESCLAILGLANE